MTIFRSYTDILLPGEVRGSIVVSDDGWADYSHGTPLTEQEVEEIRGGKMPSLVLEYADGFGIMLRVQPQTRKEAAFDEQTTALFELRMDEETADSLAAALESVVQLLRRQKAQDTHRFGVPAKGG